LFIWEVERMHKVYGTSLQSTSNPRHIYIRG
jgi:hypothetical protein